MTASNIRRAELLDDVFLDISADLVKNKHNKALLARSSTLMAEGYDPPSAWARAKTEAGIPLTSEQHLLFREYALLKAAEPPIASHQQPKPAPIARVIAAPATQSVASPLTSGFKPSPAGGWVSTGPDPNTLRKEAMLATAKRMPPAPDNARIHPVAERGSPLHAASQLDLLQARTAPEILRSAEKSDTTSMRDRTHALMSERGQSIDPKHPSYLPNYKSALIEVSK